MGVHGMCGGVVNFALQQCKVVAEVGYYKKVVFYEGTDDLDLSQNTHKPKPNPQSHLDRHLA